MRLTIAATLFTMLFVITYTKTMIHTKRTETGLFITNNKGVINVMTGKEKEQHEQRQQLKKLSLYNLITLKYFT